MKEQLTQTSLVAKRDHWQGEWKDGAISVIMRNMSKAVGIRGIRGDPWDLGALR